MVDIETVEACFRPKVLEGDISDITRPAGIGFDEGDVVSLDNADVPGDL